MRSLLIAAGLVAAGLASAQTVVLDIGHSQSVPGSTSASGIGEYAFNQRLAHAVAARLRASGIRVAVVDMTGHGGGFAARVAPAKTADLFVSIHHDSIQQAWLDAGRSRNYDGFSVFVSNRNAKPVASLACARSVGRALAATGEKPSIYHATPVPGENRPILDRAAGVHRYDGLAVLRMAQSPAILVEAGVIVNPDAERRLAQPQHAVGLAKAIAAGVVQCL